MSPRTKSNTMSTGRSGVRGSSAAEACRLSRTSPRSTQYPGTFAHDMSHNTMWNGMSALQYPEHEEPAYNGMAMDSFVIGSNSFHLSMMPTLNDCYGPPVTYDDMNRGAMSQTLSAPYHDNIIGEDVLRTSSLGLDFQHYNHLPAANFRHGLPSPPADIMDSEDQEFSIDPACDMAFTNLPESAMNSNVSFEKMSSSRSVHSFNPMMVDTDALDSASRSHYPRPIRSASERSGMDQTTLAPQDTQYSQDERGDRVKARNDPRYEQGPDKDGYYHCPLVGDGSCNHRPTKQKCIYAKYLDSHLKPYVCKHGYGKDCENLRFSSNACLFRHEREAHGLHNHGLNPYLCLYPGCERARNDNGFPRRWNQRDHMKRVHDWVEVDEVESDNHKYGRTAEPAKKRKGSGSSNGVAMKRSSSSHSKAQGITYTSGSRQTPNMAQYPGSTEKHYQHSGMLAYPATMNDMQYEPMSGYQQQPQASLYPGSPYMQLVC